MQVPSGQVLAVKCQRRGSMRLIRVVLGCLDVCYAILSECRCRFQVKRDNGNAKSVRESIGDLLVHHDGFVGFDRDIPAACIAHHLNRLRTDGGDVKAHVLTGFTNFNECPAAAFS